MLLFLIGFMGCGKSYTAKHLAPLLQIPYLDMDKEIEKAEHQSIAEIFHKKGEPYFRELEHVFIQELDKDAQFIISTGGGAPCFYNNMDLMNEKGLTIYLNRNKQDVIDRLLRGQYKRPLIADFSREELEKFYDSKLQDRKVFYEQAKLFAYDQTTEELAQQIEIYLQKN